MTIDDFEWVEEGFDVHVLIHKTREMTVAVVKHFNGWNVIVLKVYSRNNPLVVESFDAAKAIATITAINNMENFPDANTYRTRAIPAGPKKIPRGVFKVDGVRR
jgi:hypothetical protein